MHNFKISDNLKCILNKLSKKDNSLYEQVIKKIQEVSEMSDVEHYKNLRFNMKDSKRVHIGHFVLVFQYIVSNDEINFDDFEHQDNIYRK